MGISLFRRKAKAAAAPAPALALPEPTSSPDGAERLTALEWAKRLQVNAVQAERAAMRTGRWHDTFTEQEFLDLLRRQD